MLLKAEKELKDHFKGGGQSIEQYLPLDCNLLSHTITSNVRAALIV